MGGAMGFWSRAGWSRSTTRRLTVLALVSVSLSGWALVLAPWASAARMPASEAAPRFAIHKPTSHVLAKRSSTHPHWACPRERCQAIVDPPALRRGSGYALPLSRSALEGSGEKGGLDPADLTSAYKIPASVDSTQTVAVVDDFGYAAAEADLAKYRERYGLPACTKASGCFKKVNEKGEEANYPPEGESAKGWQVESALDIDMVSAACPSCQIMLVEVEPGEEGPGVNTAVGLGATEVSLSVGIPEEVCGNEAELCKAETADLSHPGVPITVSAGDFGYNDHELESLIHPFRPSASPSYPASLPTVISVGGTVLKKATNARGWSESVWKSSGSGCSAAQEKPSWQTEVSTNCEHRLDNDVAVVAACESPVSVYTTAETGWANICGTSASAPLVAGILAHASEFVRSAGARAFYEPSPRFDVTLGSNGTCTPKGWCTAEPGYDGPSGVGTPEGVPTLVRPDVTKVEPNVGPQAGGTPVTISGTGFSSGQGDAVAFGSALAPFFGVESATSIQAVSPAGSGTVDVTVEGEPSSPTSAADHFTYLAKADLSYTGPTQAVDEQSLTLSARLTDDGTANAIAGHVVEFAVGAEHCEAATDATGVASCVVQIDDLPGNYTVTANVTAGAGYLGASTSVGFTVLETPVYGRCLKAPSTKVERKSIYHGNFTSASCTARSTTKEGKFEWHAGLGPKTSFTLASKPAATIKLESTGGHVLLCSGAVGNGKLTGLTTATMNITLTGCSEGGEKCSSGSAGTEGEIQLNTLFATLAWQNRSLKKVDLKLAGSGVEFGSYECPTRGVVLAATGILLPVTVNKFSTKATDKLAQRKGQQMPSSIESEGPFSFGELRIEGSMKTFEGAGLGAVLLQTYEEGYEINTVV
jgi:hypothetical protein